MCLRTIDPICSTPWEAICRTVWPLSERHHGEAQCRPRKPHCLDSLLAPMEYRPVSRCKGLVMEAPPTMTWNEGGGGGRFK